MIQGLFKLALRNTLRRGKKSWITVIGVFIGIAAVVSLVSLGQGLETAIEQEFQGLGADNVFVNGDIDDSHLDTVRNTRGVDEAGGIYQETRQFEYQGETVSLTFAGVELSKVEMIFNSQGWEVEEGRMLRSVDRNSIILGTGARDSFEDPPRVRSQLAVDEERFRVIGFFTAGDPQFQSSALTGLDTARDISGAEDELSRIVVQIQPGFSQEEVVNDIEDNLRRQKGLREGNEDFDVSTPQDIQESLTSILGIVQGIVVGLASIALLVGGIGIMNTMYMSINERTQEIGVLKAIGASKRQIRLLFLMEAGLIGFIGGVIGVLIGIGISEIAVFATADLGSLRIARGYSLSLIVGSLIFSTLIGILSGYIPARRASRLEPADALRYE
jgi:putative ABC transport system permease protein